MKIYLLSSSLNGKRVYKIGFTKRQVEERVKEFRTGNSNQIEIEKIFESKWARKIEKILHRHFKKEKVQGEWFTLDEKQVEDFNFLCQQNHDNIELLNKYNTWVLQKGGYNKIK